MTDPTPAEVRRVREYECKMRGHSWDVIQLLDVPPSMIVCRNCGKSYAVGRRA
jgi:hypothetical protein